MLMAVEFVNEASGISDTLLVCGAYKNAGTNEPAEGQIDSAETMFLAASDDKINTKPIRLIIPSVSLEIDRFFINPPKDSLKFQTQVSPRQGKLKRNVLIQNEYNLVP